MDGLSWVCMILRASLREMWERIVIERMAWWAWICVNMLRNYPNLSIEFAQSSQVVWTPLWVMIVKRLRIEAVRSSLGLSV